MNAITYTLQLIKEGHKLQIQSHALTVSRRRYFQVMRLVWKLAWFTLSLCLLYKLIHHG
jgi:hypothetical protein